MTNEELEQIRNRCEGSDAMTLLKEVDHLKEKILKLQEMLKPDVRTVCAYELGLSDLKSLAKTINLKSSLAAKALVDI